MLAVCAMAMAYSIFLLHCLLSSELQVFDTIVVSRAQPLPSWLVKVHTVWFPPLQLHLLNQFQQKICTCWIRSPRKYVVATSYKAFWYHPQVLAILHKDSFQSQCYSIVFQQNQNCTSSLRFHKHWLSVHRELASFPVKWLALTSLFHLLINVMVLIECVFYGFLCC